MQTGGWHIEGLGGPPANIKGCKNFDSCQKVTDLGNGRCKIEIVKSKGDPCELTDDVEFSFGKGLDFKISKECYKEGGVCDALGTCKNNRKRFDYIDLIQGASQAIGTLQNELEGGGRCMPPGIFNTITKGLEDEETNVIQCDSGSGSCGQADTKNKHTIIIGIPAPGIKCGPIGMTIRHEWHHNFTGDLHEFIPNTNTFDFTSDRVEACDLSCFGALYTGVFLDGFPDDERRKTQVKKCTCFGNCQ